MAARVDNSAETNLNGLLPRTGEGVVIDIGTGDGRFVYAAARKNPAKFYIGIDANVRPLKKPSMKATRKLSKGGLPNALFVQTAVEDLPDELDGVADEIHIHFPWGSLLKAVATGDPIVVAAFRRISAPACILEIIIGIDPERDKSEIQRLGLPALSPEYLRDSLVPRFATSGFSVLESGVLDPAEWPKLDTSWARKLSGRSTRSVSYIVMQAK